MTIIHWLEDSHDYIVGRKAGPRRFTIPVSREMGLNYSRDRPGGPVNKIISPGLEAVA
jgi:hypothetical protein